MKTLCVLLATIAVSAAASIMTMDDREFEKMMMGRLAAQGNMAPLMNLHALMDTQDQQQHEPLPVEAEGELSDADEAADDQGEVAVDDDDHKPIITDAVPYTSKQPSHRPTGSNGNRKPANGNGKRGGGSAAAASATSFSRGPNSFSSSQAQAFSRGSK